MNRSQIPGFRQRSVLLCTAYIAGAIFKKGMLEWLSHQSVGTLFVCEAEPENAFDPCAVLLKTVVGIPGDVGTIDRADIKSECVGYIARAHNLLPAQLLAAKQALCAILVEADPRAKVNSRYTVAVYYALA